MAIRSKKTSNGSKRAPAPKTKAGRATLARLGRTKRAVQLTQAAAQTIAHRSSMMGREMISPTGSANPEFARMGLEKIFAAGEAQVAMLKRLTASHGIWTSFWFQQAQRGVTLLPQLALSGTPTRMAETIHRAGSMMVADYTALWAKAVTLTEVVADAGARPIYRAAAANARRLGAA